jgi:hypothetical protein
MLDAPRTYQLILYDAATGKEIGRATVLDTHRLNVGDDLGEYRIVRVRPESTREAGHVDVTGINSRD